MYLDQCRETLSQGDIIGDVFLVDIPLTLISDEGEDYIFNFEDQIDTVEIPITKCNLIILSQTCDIGRRDFIATARLYPIEKT